jgi:hypothetical protein
MLLACVLECSSIGAMIFLCLLVVFTRIGVNKEPPPEPDKPDAGPAADAPKPDPGPDTIPS